MNMYVAKLAACGAVLVGVALAPAAATTIKLTAVGAPPPLVTPVKVTKEYIIPEINRRLAASGKDFKIDWREAWAGSLANFNEVFEAVEEGIGQFGVLLKNFEESKLPLEQYTYMIPFGTESTAILRDIDAELRSKIPAMNEQFLKFKQIHLASAASQTTDLFTKFPVKSIDDLKGHKIGASGAMAAYLRGTGAVAVNAAMSNSYTDIKNGVYDGYPMGIGLAFPYRTYEVTKFATLVNFGSGSAAALSMNKAAWDALPDFAKTIFLDVAKEYGPQYAKVDEDRKTLFVAQMKKKGVVFSDFPAAERSRWAHVMPNVTKAWVDRLEGQGLPARQLVMVYMAGLRKHNVPIARDWDKELN